MKKNNKIVLLIFLALLVVAVVVFFTRYELKKENYGGKSKLKIELKNPSVKTLRDFSVEDTASINKIFLVDKDNNSVLLERNDKFWTVNGTYDSRYDLTNLLLETIRRIEVSSPISKTKNDYVIRDLATNGIKCEIYQKNKLVLTYFVGGVTPNNTGTYMLIKGSSEPFVVSLPGFSGYLTTRYNTSEDEWKSRRVFSYVYSDIASVEVDFPDDPEQSYRAESYGDNKYGLVKLKDNEPLDEFNLVMVKKQISRFKKVGFEFSLSKEENSIKLDSLSSEVPMYTFSVKDREGNVKQLSCYQRANLNENLDDEGNPFGVDVERLYGVFDDNVVVMQYLTVDELSLKLKDLQ